MAKPPIPVVMDRLRLDVLIVPLEDRRRAVVPDPRRYEVIDEGERQGLYDRTGRLFYPWPIVEQMIAQAETVPKGSPSPRVDLQALLDERRIALAAAFAAAPADLPSVHLSDDALRTMVGGREAFAVVCADVVGSTELSARNADAHERLMPVLCSELAEIVGRFGGFVANFGGDGGVFLFPPTGFCAANDAAYDAATAIVAVHYAAFVPAARAAGLPAIDLRVGADSGDLAVRVIGSDANQRQADVFGLAISLAAKVQGRARPGEVWLGETIAANVHITRQQLCEEADTPSDWPYETFAGVPYRLFRTEIPAAADAIKHSDPSV